MTKKGILLVATGTSNAEAGKTLDLFGLAIGRYFEDCEIQWAFTAGGIRRKLAERGQPVDSPSEALGRMLEDGFTHVVVQPLYILVSEAHRTLKDIVATYVAKGSMKLAIGDTLLRSEADIQRVADVAIAAVPEERNKKDAVVFVGHGSRKEEANHIYDVLEARLAAHDPLFFIGTLSRGPEEVVFRCLDRKVARVFLIPLMFVAGYHARNDIAGEGRHTWHSAIQRADMEPVVDIRGLAERSGIIDLCVDHIRNAWKGIEDGCP